MRARPELVEGYGPNAARRMFDEDASKLDGAEGPQDKWPEPDLAVLRLDRRPPPPIPLDVFEDFWAKWIAETARASACPFDDVAAPLLASASVVIGHVRWAQASAIGSSRLTCGP